MPTINLLPWRKMLAERQRRTFYRVLGGCSASCMLLLVVGHGILGRHIDLQGCINTQLQQEIASLAFNDMETVKQDKNNLIVKIERIQQLEEARWMMVHLFDDIVRVLPAGIFLTQLSGQGTNIVLMGQAESTASVSELIGNIETASRIKNSKLIQIKRDQGIGRRYFELAVEHSMPKEKSDSES